MPVLLPDACRPSRPPRVAIVSSPRSWAAELERHVAEHGGALIRARVLDERTALTEDYDVLVCEDVTSFLTRRLVADLRAGGRRILGLHDARDAAGRRWLEKLDVDAILDTSSRPEVVVAHAAMLAAMVTDLDEAFRELIGSPM